MIEHLPFNSLLALLTAFCGIFIITGAWLYLLMVHSKAKRINLSGFGVHLTVDTAAYTRASDERQVVDESAS